MSALTQKPLGGGDDPLPSYDEQLAVAVEEVLHQQERHLKALRAIANNLATSLELNGLGGIASLKQQLMAHDLPEE